MSETKTEWPTLDAVPADVRTVWDQLGDEYRRKGDTWEFRFPGIEWTEMARPPRVDENCVPFTSVQGLVSSAHWLESPPS